MSNGIHFNWIEYTPHPYSSSLSYICLLTTIIHLALLFTYSTPTHTRGNPTPPPPPPPTDCYRMISTLLFSIWYFEFEFRKYESVISRKCNVLWLKSEQVELLSKYQTLSIWAVVQWRDSFMVKTDVSSSSSGYKKWCWSVTLWMNFVMRDLNLIEAQIHILKHRVKKISKHIRNQNGSTSLTTRW